MNNLVFLVTLFFYAIYLLNLQLFSFVNKDLLNSLKMIHSFIRLNKILDILRYLNFENFLKHFLILKFIFRSSIYEGL